MNVTNCAEKSIKITLNMQQQLHGKYSPKSKGNLCCNLLINVRNILCLHLTLVVILTHFRFSIEFNTTQAINGF